MKIVEGICWPDMPSYRRSSPSGSMPSWSRSTFPKSRAGFPSFMNAVASPIAPRAGTALPNRDSRSCAIVIRLGIQCGFTIISGTMPAAVRGMSCARISMPIVPFWP